MNTLHALRREFIRTQLIKRLAVAAILLFVVSMIRINGGLARADGSSLNIWDSLFLVINHSNLIFFCYIPTFLILLSDAVYSSSIGHEYVYQIRCRSRSIWWKNKIIYSLVNIGGYVLLLSLCPVLVALLSQQSLSWDWSPYSLYVFEQDFMLSHIPVNFSAYSPGAVFIMDVLLLFMTFFVLGTTSMLFTVIFHHGYAGSIITYTLLLINHFFAKDSIYSFFRYISINNLYIDKVRSSPGNLFIFDAYTLLILLSLVSIATGFYLCNRTDFLHKEHTRW